MVDIARRAFLLILLSLQLGWWSGAAGEDQALLHKMDIQGHKAASIRTILKMMVTREGRPWDDAILEGDIQSLLSWYRDEGYLRAHIFPPKLSFNQDSSQVDLTLLINEGPLVRIGQVEIQGKGWLRRETIEEQMDLRSGQVFRGDVLEADVQRLLTVYENNGYPYCQIQATRFRLTAEDRLDFGLTIQEGARVRVQSVVPEGNTITKSSVICRELGIDEGDLYNQRAIEQGHRRLQRLGFFGEVGEIQVLPGDRSDLAVLVVPVVEGRTNTIDGVLGYQPATEQRDGYFTGLLDLSFRNLMGTGRRVEAAWSRCDPLSSKLRFAYQEPWLLGLPLTLGGYIQQVNQDSSYAQTDLGIQAHSAIGEHVIGGVMFDWQRVIPDIKGGQDLPGSRSYLAGVWLELDIRDDLLAPRRGGRYQTMIRQRFKKNQATETYQPARSRVESTEFTGELEQYVRVFRHQVVAVNLHLGEIYSDEVVVPLNEQFKLGGARTLRGYREEQFHGSRIIWANLEYRFLLGRRSWSFLFLDAGHYFYRKIDPLTEAVQEVSGEKIGYGVGLRLESRLGIVGVDYGLGEGDGLADGKVHFGVINEF